MLGLGERLGLRLGEGLRLCVWAEDWFCEGED